MLLCLSLITISAAAAPSNVLVYVTGVTEGSPSYEQMVEGAEDFASEKEDITLKIYEAGFNQAEWESQLIDLLASNHYDYVVSSNPSLTDICSNAASLFPDVKFILTDAWLEGNPQVKTYLFNQYEQSYILGYLAGLVTISDMKYANPEKKIGFITAQEYPLLNNHMVPGFLAGAQQVDPDITVDFRVIGNWYDANKTAELGSSMIASGVDVFAVIAGGAAQGLFQTVEKEGAYIVFHNDNEYEAAPGLVVGCGMMGQRQLIKDALSKAFAGEMDYGTAEIVGVSNGYMDFIDDDPLYDASLPEDIRDRFGAFLSDIRSGKIVLELPPLNQSEE